MALIAGLLLSKKLGISLSMAPWNELSVKLLLNPSDSPWYTWPWSHWSSAQPGLYEPSWGSFAPAVLCILPRSVLDILKPTFTHSIPMLAHRLLSSCPSAGTKDPTSMWHPATEGGCERFTTRWRHRVTLKLWTKSNGNFLIKYLLCKSEAPGERAPLNPL